MNNTFRLEEDYDYQADNDYSLIESNYYAPSDDRTWKSYVEDIDGGDTFIDYCEYIFDFLEETGYYD